MDWIDLAQDGERWRELVNAVINFPGSINCGEILDYLRTCQLLRKDSAACSQLLYVTLAVAQLVDALRHKSGGRGFDSRTGHRDFSTTSFFRPTHGHLLKVKMAGASG
jgi:hypothetical protein